MRKFTATLFVSALLLSPQSSMFQTKAEDLARARGVIRAVDLSLGTVAIHTRDDQTVVLRTNDRTQITRNGERAMLEDLRQGDRATAVYDPATMLAAQIDARGETANTLVRVEGVISGVDTGASTVTIFPTPNGPRVRSNPNGRRCSGYAARQRQHIDNSRRPTRESRRSEARLLRGSVV